MHDLQRVTYLPVSIVRSVATAKKNNVKTALLVTIYQSICMIVFGAIHKLRMRKKTICRPPIFFLYEKMDGIFFLNVFFTLHVISYVLYGWPLLSQVAIENKLDKQIEIKIPLMVLLHNIRRCKDVGASYRVHVKATKGSDVISIM